MVQQEYDPAEHEGQYTEFIKFCVRIETAEEMVGSFKTQKIKTKKDLKSSVKRTKRQPI